VSFRYLQLILFLFLSLTPRKNDPSYVLLEHCGMISTDDVFWEDTLPA
jgi:hypothetical protein